MSPRSAPFGSPRARAYPALSKLKRDGWIARYIASQAPNGHWGFRVTMPDDSEYWMLPREVLAFAEGITVASNTRLRDTASGGNP